MSHNRGLTMVEALVTIVALTILTTLLLPMLLGAEGARRRSYNTAQLRGIHQALVIYSHGNGGHFPGLDRSGRPIPITVQERYKILIDANYFTPEYVIAPLDRSSGAKQEWSGGPFTSDHYSYAMLQVPASGGRHAEWSETVNPDAVVLADRNIGTVSNPSSIHNGQPIPDHRRSGCTWIPRHYGPDWVGVIVRNDNSVSFETTHLHNTDYAGHVHVDDHLFEAAGNDDAYLIHSGN